MLCCHSKQTKCRFLWWLFYCACTLPIWQMLFAELNERSFYLHLPSLPSVSKPGDLGWTMQGVNALTSVHFLCLDFQTSFLRSAGLAGFWKQSSLLSSMTSVLKSKFLTCSSLLKKPESRFCHSHWWMYSQLLCNSTDEGYVCYRISP